MDFVVDIGGKDHVLDSDDQYLSQVGRVFEPQTVALFRVLAPQPRTVLDVGANVGCTALLFADMSKRVHAFEPSTSTFSFLAKNTSSVPNISIHNLGLGAKHHRSQITFNEQNRSGGFVSMGTTTNEGHVTETIEIETLDRFARRHQVGDIDFIKLDVEGYEAHVIKGGKKTLRKNRPTVTLELNHWCLNAFQRTSVPDFFDYLRSVFPVLYAVERGTYLNLHDAREAYIAMYFHIVHGQYKSLVGAYSTDQLAAFLARHEHRSINH
ncbi:FkbM family methyltransferase [Dyella japonica]|uniref:FkbM family methyltransferase n=1 Tax=Dyella japonica TaxID=231455 RepID=A0ABV2JZ51_9GAMM